MKKRWSLHFLAGLVFGASYWHYFSFTAHLFNSISSNVSSAVEILLFVLAVVVYFGVWLFPTILPAIHEFRHSTSLRLSILAVVTVWISAVLGYYVNYVAMLAFVGLPHMEYLVVIGQRTSTLWQDWSVIFPKLILYKFVKWAIVGVLMGGLAGLIVSKTYSLLRRNEYKTSSV